MSNLFDADGSMVKWAATLAVPVGKFLVGLVGAVVSLKFLKEASRTERSLMVLGGSVLSYLGSPLLARWVGWADAEGLVGFLLGLFGMALVMKIYEGILSLDGSVLASDLIAYLKSFLPSKRQ